MYSSLFKYKPTTLTSNMFLSLKSFFLQKLISTLTNLNSTKKFSIVDASPNYLYKHPVKYSSIVFFKNKLNNILYYNLYMLVANYLCYKNTNNLNLTNLPLNTNFHIFTFLNLFYFKVRNY